MGLQAFRRWASPQLFRITSSSFFLAIVLLACGRAGLSNSSSAAPSSASAARGQSDAGGNGQTCPACTADPARYVRQLSLDLRGRPPSLEELEKVDTLGSVPPEMIDGMLHSSEFLERIRAWHASLLWPNLDGFHIRGGGLVGADYDDRTGKRKGGFFSPDPTLLDDAPVASPSRQSREPPAGSKAAGKGKKKREPGHGFVLYSDGAFQRVLRGGGDGSIGCDPTLEYPKPAVPPAAQPTYTTVGTDKKKRKYPYYDRDGVPLPYHDAAHCPNYCSNNSDAERAAPGFKPKHDSFAPMDAKGADAHPQELDPPDAHCPDAFPHRVVNVCDNHAVNEPENYVRIRRDGFRMMRHYWSGNTEIRTCAYETQERTNSTTTGVPCPGNALREPSCGCGPNGIYCMPVVNPNSTVASKAEYLVRSALNEEPLEIVTSVIGRDEDYFDIFRTRRSFITGPLEFLYKNQLATVQGLSLSAPAPPEAFPQVPYADFTFHEYVRNPEHSGVLTTPAYLGRFPTWRSRVSQFRTAFMCRPFTPGSAALPSPDDSCTREPNLARRCGCKNCHSAIEPMAAWFGRWAERSAEYLSPAEYPTHDPACERCAYTKEGCTPRCRTQYVVDTLDADSARYAGTLRSYLYRSKEDEPRIDEGPSGLVASAIASGELESCTIRTAWGKLLGRPMSDDEMNLVLPALAQRFTGNHHNYRDLVKAIVTSPAYRRVD